MFARMKGCWPSCNLNENNADLKPLDWCACCRSQTNALILVEASKFGRIGLVLTAYQLSFKNYCTPNKKEPFLSDSFGKFLDYVKFAKGRSFFSSASLSTELLSKKEKETDKKRYVLNK